MTHPRRETTFRVQPTLLTYKARLIDCRQWSPVCHPCATGPVRRVARLRKNIKLFVSVSACSTAYRVSGFRKSSLSLHRYCEGFSIWLLRRWRQQELQSHCTSRIKRQAPAVLRTTTALSHSQLHPHQYILRMRIRLQTHGWRLFTFSLKPCGMHHCLSRSLLSLVLLYPIRTSHKDKQQWCISMHT